MATPRWVNGESGAAPPAWLWPLVMWAVAAILAVVLLFSVRAASWPLAVSAGGLPLLIAGGLQLAWTAGRNSRVRLDEERAEATVILHDLRGSLLTARSNLDLLGSEAFGPCRRRRWMAGIEPRRQRLARTRWQVSSVRRRLPPARGSESNSPRCSTRYSRRSPL